MIQDQQSLVIWVIDDGKPGHRNQSLGFAEAMGRIQDVSIHLLSLPHNVGVFSRIKKVREEASKLPKPKMIIAAGHRTHFPLIYLANKTGARSVVLMRPSLPFGWFDHCLIPEHDFAEGRKAPENVTLTKGALNRVTYDPEVKDGSGLILIGGKSSEFGFNGESLHKAIIEIVGQDEGIQWTLTDSRRTPAGFIESLKDVPITTCPHQTTSSNWLPEQLRRASVVWVTEDSVSMIYEALSSGAKVGLLPMPRVKNPGRVAKGVEALVEEGRLCRYELWQETHKLPQCWAALVEADQCARSVTKDYA
jgi:mitochondrial fission protein ELM1